MLNQQPPESKHLFRQVCKSASQRLGLDRDPDEAWRDEASLLAGRFSGRLHQTPAEAARTPAGFAQGFSLYPVWDCHSLRRRELTISAARPIIAAASVVASTAYPAQRETVEL
jgi:hypothetical protein